jgi:DNA helicase-2/ATP-dependent DNA helicase PcrA
MLAKVSLSLDRPPEASTPPPGAPAQEAFTERPEVRDVLAWMRLLSDPGDATAVARALVRPPIELRQSDLVGVIQIARRGRLDMVAALRAALESPQIAPQARECIGRFLDLHRSAAAALEAGRPDLFVRTISGGEREGREQQSSAPIEQLQTTLRMMREEVMGDVARIAHGLSELRLDSDLDVSHGIARYLELVKLTALLERPAGQSVAEALPEINARLAAAVTSLQREIFQTSPLDAALLEDECDEHAQTGAPDNGEALRARALAPRGEPSLRPFLPRIGQGLVLSASDIQTYRSCPLRYKYARVLRVPTEQTLPQRFGIAVHQVLERYHTSGASTLAELMELLQTAWRRGGFGDSQKERELHEKARVALTRYHERLRGHQEGEPAWFERSFSFTLGPHQVRGRVDRVDELPDGSHELIDYKTGRPKDASQLGEDVQLSLYALAAREDWGLQAPRLAYYYVLDDQKVPVPPRAQGDEEWIREVVIEVAEGILAQQFEPTPAPTVCAMCDFRTLCPVAAPIFNGAD